jgi:formylglycine-generating enzyme required for sulfatase activity
MSQNLKLFINYRRADEALFVQLMRTHFMYRYGRENVFMDFDTIPPFTLFEDFIRQKVRECDTLVAVIGPRWLELMQAKAAEGKPDFVRIEIEEALKHGKIVAPICIQGAQVPPLEHIPAELRVIFQRHVPELYDGQHILDNIHPIMDALENALARQGTPRSVANPTNELEGPSGTTDVRVAVRRYFEARAASKLPESLVWLSLIRESDAMVPTVFDLDQRESEIQALLKAQEDERRRLEVADYLYTFVRGMVKFNEPVAEIRAALNEIWAVYEGYDPDGLAATVDGSASDETNTTATLPLTAPFEWVDIPAGRVTLSDHKGAFDVAAFAISKFPITVAQFGLFVDDGGYNHEHYWTSAGWLWRKIENVTFPRYWQNEAFQQSDHPVVGVSWYEAMAFCNWLRKKLGVPISLPTEQQWQWAAQGDTGRAYPWGNVFQAECCNFNAGHTTPVNAFGEGKSPFGVMDMSGNVSEWCLTEYATASNNDLKSTKDRVVRGGSAAYVIPEFLRVDFRESDHPNGGGFRTGFRIVRNS